MACNFLSHWLPCFGGQVDNPNGNGNMFDLLFRFRWLTRCFGDDPESPETSIQGYSGNMFSRFLQPVCNDVDPEYYYWQRKLGRHLYGQYSMAVAQANLQIEDRSQLVSGSLKEGVGGPRGVFVGIYDGHGGATCSQFILDNLFKNFKSVMQNHNAVNLEVIREAYRRTEDAFMDHVRQNWQSQPELAFVGSCCLVGVVLRNVLYVANAGDCRAVVAQWPNGSDLNDMQVIQLSVDYTANDPERRAELLSEHPTLSFTFASGQWYIRRALHSLQPTRAIGDVYMKHNEFNLAPHYLHGEPIAQPIVKAEPTIQTHPIGPDDKFVIFASDGLWDEMDNIEAAELVRDNPRHGAAARLLREAMDKAASRRGKECDDLRYVMPRNKRQYHDDISIVIVFFDNLEAQAAPPPPPPPPQADPLIRVDNLESQAAPPPPPPQADPLIRVDNLEAQAAQLPPPPPPPQADPLIHVDNLEEQAAPLPPPSPPQADALIRVDNLEAQAAPLPPQADPLIRVDNLEAQAAPPPQPPPQVDPAQATPPPPQADPLIHVDNLEEQPAPLPPPPPPQADALIRVDNLEAQAAPLPPLPPQADPLIRVDNLEEQAAPLPQADALIRVDNLEAQSAPLPPLPPQADPLIHVDNLEAQAAPPPQADPAQATPPPPLPPQADPLIHVDNLEAQAAPPPQANPTIPDDNLEVAAAPPSVE